ncbi:1,2-phenylacetyl-CoA epoxidase subunit PaaE [Angustibacter sp. McL0619]|uniref:1,2-phenylacetyl-CoA epoxidase subunit PaaE n=1 Tax=Angustibacter sp. McL0619 TaxID=3415676 RepID=UPI003CF5851B
MGTTSTAPQVSARTHASFNPLRLAGIGHLTNSSVTLTFDVPAALREAYRFTPGQHLTLRTSIDGEEVRRSYSICAPPSSGLLQVAVKTLEGGAFSSHARTGLSVGDELDVMTPAGRFGVPLDPTQHKSYAAIVAGSGITPVMSILPAVLATEPQSTFTLVYGNRDSGSVMFVEELADLKDRYPDRLQFVHVLSREPQDADLLTGRIDDTKLDVLLTSLLPPETIDEWLLCGPFELVQQVRAALVDRGVANEAIHLELFHVDGEAPRLARLRTEGTDAGCQVTVRLDGRSTSFSMPDEGSVLDATLAVRADAPFACKGGVCGTCRIKVVEGDVEMSRNFALEPSEIAEGFALACQSVPTSDRLVVDFDA